MKIYEKIDNTLMFSRDDVRLLSNIIKKATKRNDITLSAKYNGFFADGCDHYFVTFTQKELADRFSISQTKVSNRIKELCEFGALKKFSKSTYLINFDWLNEEYKETAA